MLEEIENLHIEDQVVNQLIKRILNVISVEKSITLNLNINQSLRIKRTTGIFDF